MRGEDEACAILVDVLIFEDVRNHAHELFVHVILKLINDEIPACLKNILNEHHDVLPLDCAGGNEIV